MNEPSALKRLLHVAVSRPIGSLFNYILLLLLWSIVVYVSFCDTLQCDVAFHLVMISPFELRCCMAIVL